MSTITRAHLVDLLHTRIGLSRQDNSDVLESVLENIAASLESGETVKLSGLGTFAVRKKGRRIGRNPKTGEEVAIQPRSVLIFRPSQMLKSALRAAPIKEKRVVEEVT